jgi:hypothetical protein
MIRFVRLAVSSLIFTGFAAAQTAAPAPPAAPEPPPAPDTVIKLPEQTAMPSPAPSYAKTPGYYSMPFEGNMPANQMPGSLHVRISIDGASPTTVLMDTGSTGIVIGADELPHLDPKAPKGDITYTSSGFKEEGTWQTVTVTFPDAKYHGPNDGKPHVATAKVRVLAVTHLSCLNMGPNKGCHPSNDPSPHMLGIGFGRGALRAEAPNNPFISLNDMNDGTIRAGYIITHAGIQFGLTDDSTAGFNFQKLTPRPDAKPDNLAGSPKDWITEPGGFIVNGERHMGTVLMDTGLNNMMLAIDGESKPAPVDAGTPISILMPGGKYKYEFRVGDTSTASPSKVNWVYPRSGTYVNTGLHAFNLFDYLYDADGGYLGLRPKK